MTLLRSDLHDYQKVAINRIIENMFYALFLEMGLGKSISALTAIVDLFNEFTISKVLIIAPLRVCINTWPDEITSWEHTKHLSFTQLAGQPAGVRKKALKENTNIHIINRELIPWLIEQKCWEYDMVIIDESSSFKNPSSKRFRALKKVRGKINRLVELTGSPAPNGLMDIYAPMWLLDTGERLGRTLTQYRQRYFDQDFMGWSWELREGSDKKIHEKIKDITLSMKAIDHLKMPEAVHNIVEIELPAKARKIYDELEKELFVVLDEAKDLTAMNMAALSNKCLQLSNGAVYTEDDTVDVHTEKLDALESIIAEAEGSPVLVAYQFKSDLRRIKKRFKAVELDKNPETIKKWNTGEIPLLIAHPASAGHGLNLQKGGNIIAWFGLNWSLELYEQMNARLHRQGQTETVFIHHIVAKDTIDEKVMLVVQEKMTIQEALKEAVK